MDKIPKIQPKVMAGAKLAKNRKNMEARHWKLSPSLMSLQYQGKRRFTSLCSPPNGRWVRCKLSSGITDIRRRRRALLLGLDIGDTSSLRDIRRRCCTFLFNFWRSARGRSDSLSRLPGGRTMLSAKNSFIALSRSRRSSALYAASWKSCHKTK